MPSTFSRSSSGLARARLAAKISWLGVALSMGSLRFQGVVNVVAFPTRLSVVDLHVEGQRELAIGKDGIEIVGKRCEHVLTRLLTCRQVAPFAEPQQHRDKAVILAAVRDRIVLAAQSAHPDAADREDAGLDGCLADDLAKFAHVYA